MSGRFAGTASISSLEHHTYRLAMSSQQGKLDAEKPTVECYWGHEQASVQSPTLGECCSLRTRHSYPWKQLWDLAGLMKIKLREKSILLAQEISWLRDNSVFDLPVSFLILVCKPQFRHAFEYLCCLCCLCCIIARACLIDLPFLNRNVDEEECSRADFKLTRIDRLFLNYSWLY